MRNFTRPLDTRATTKKKQRQKQKHARGMARRIMSPSSLLDEQPTKTRKRLSTDSEGWFRFRRFRNSTSSTKTLIRSAQRIKMEKQLDDLKGEIDVIVTEIRSKESQLISAAEADKADIRTSIDRSNTRLDVLLASRHELSLALAAADPPGKNARLSRR